MVLGNVSNNITSHIRNGVRLKKLEQLASLGQSVWLDTISRSLLTSGELNKWLAAAVRGVTSNPTIFEKAITGSTDYDADLLQLPRSFNPQECYEALAVADIRMAADMFLPVFHQTQGLDGFVSLEVNPRLAHDTQGTVAEAKRLFGAVDRPNLMIKVPATIAGISAIQELIASGININVTLIFGVEHYLAVAESYLTGLEERLARRGALGQVASVASCFVSRIDTLIDEKLAEKGVAALQGKSAVANSKVIYAEHKNVFSGKRWELLVKNNARIQRVLWASTGTKNKQYSDTHYVDQLVGPNTVNTLPPATLEAFIDHGSIVSVIDQGLTEAKAHLQELALLGIKLDQVTQKLQDDGVTAFASSMDALLRAIADKRDSLL